MRLDVEEFREWNNKRITLLGMSGVGKTRISNLLIQGDWFHFSADYRIGTRYLNEPILDNLKQQVMQIPFLNELLRTDSIFMRNNINVNNLKPVSSFLGKVGNPERGGMSLTEFKRRQALHHDAEIAALLDVPSFAEKARTIYGYSHFVNDAGGSLCELDSDQVFATLEAHTVVLYIKASVHDEQVLIQRAEQAPKPLYYRPEFLEEQLSTYMEQHGMEYSAQIDPDDFVRWVFPNLFYSRIPRYDELARRYGYTVTTDEIAHVASESDFLALVERAIARES